MYLRFFKSLLEKGGIFLCVSRWTPIIAVYLWDTEVMKHCKPLDISIIWKYL